MLPNTLFDREKLRQSVAGLAPPQRLAFALGCAERLYPNYLAFSCEQQWGDPGALRAALDLAWEALEGRPLSTSALREAQDRALMAAPDTEDFQTPLVSAALDAAVASRYLLAAVQADDNIEPVVNIAITCYDTVEMYVQATVYAQSTPPQLQVDLHPLVQAELQRQQDDLQFLATAAWSPSEVARLKDIWREPEVSNIGLPRSS